MDDDALDDDDYAGFNTADDDATDTCPHCGEEIYEDAPRCPECGTYLSDLDSPTGRHPWWILIGVAVCLLIVLAWAWGG
ncbi:MAG: zinc-ribbon domain-containing protein [Pirellulaceae bacterium]